MEEQKTWKWFIAFIIFAIVWLLVYTFIHYNLFDIRNYLLSNWISFDFGKYIWRDDDYVIYWDDYSSIYPYELSIQDIGYNWDNAPKELTPNTTWKRFYYADDYDNPPLSKAMKEMNLRATYCPYIFCQQANDDWEFVNLKHYYWDEENEKMILLKNVYYVSDCLYYDNLFLQGVLELE